jgi:neutral ceramidase
MSRFASALAASVVALVSANDMQIGTGIYDMTGPISDVLLMGMANPSQVSAGLHQRLRARAFVAVDTVTDKRIAFVSTDVGMGGIVLNNRVMVELQKRAPGLYTHENVAISGTHTHSAPSGFLQDTIFQFAGSGWVPATVESYVTGIVEAIMMAHNNLAPADGFVSVGELDEANINRSPTAYLLNPKAERAKYTHNTDHNMTLLKLVTKAGEEIGMFNWFAVHGTSMNNTNLLVSGDNKGYASYLIERAKNRNSSMAGVGPFVAAFAATNLGDVSPNTGGPHCRDTGEPCDNQHSTCNGKVEQCSSYGPGVDMFDSTRIIGQKQSAKALELYDSPGTALHGTVDYAHMYVMMPGTNVSDPVTGKPLGTLCKAAMGDAFAAGTTDGPGMFDFTQGVGNSSNPFWNFIGGLLHKATPAEKACQAPKQILLSTGSINFPYPWGPDVLPMQILKLGQLVILSVPTELTTMAGRRMRDQLKQVLVDANVVGDDAVIVIAGLSNGYADYTVTFEEFQQQRYEGGSTIFGPHQLNGYIQELSKLARKLGNGTNPGPGPTPADFSNKFSGKNLISTDHLPSGSKHFGDVVTDVAPSYTAGTGVASVSYAGANPNNNLNRQGTFFVVERCTDAAKVCGDSSVSVAVDGDWETRLHIKKTTVDVVEKARTWTVEWHIPAGTEPGTYRISFVGTSCDIPIFGSPKFTDFSGQSKTFTVVAAAD